MYECNFQDMHALFAKYDIDLTTAQYDLLAKYAELLVSESTRQNVTAVRTVPEIWIRHFLDSAYLMRFIRADAKIIDMGTGGGVPAIPLSVLGCTNMTLLDSELRKIEFCADVISCLGIGAKTICGRGEELGKEPTYRGKYDFVVSRAMANGSMLTELSLPFLKVGGRLLAMKGRGFSPENERFTEAAAALGGAVIDVHPYVIEDEEKVLVIVEKTVETPAQYPRRFAKIKRNPL